MKISTIDNVKALKVEADNLTWGCCHTDIPIYHGQQPYFMACGPPLGRRPVAHGRGSPGFYAKGAYSLKQTNKKK